MQFRILNFSSVFVTKITPEFHRDHAQWSKIKELETFGENCSLSSHDERDQQVVGLDLTWHLQIQPEESRLCAVSSWILGTVFTGMSVSFSTRTQEWDFKNRFQTDQCILRKIMVWIFSSYIFLVEIIVHMFRMSIWLEEIETNRV